VNFVNKKRVFINNKKCQKIISRVNRFLIKKLQKLFKKKFQNYQKIIKSRQNINKYFNFDLCKLLAEASFVIIPAIFQL